MRSYLRAASVLLLLVSESTWGQVSKACLEATFKNDEVILKDRPNEKWSLHAHVPGLDPRDLPDHPFHHRSMILHGPQGAYIIPINGNRLTRTTMEENGERVLSYFRLPPDETPYALVRTRDSKGNLSQQIIQAKDVPSFVYKVTGIAMTTSPKTSDQIMKMKSREAVKFTSEQNKTFERAAVLAHIESQEDLLVQRGFDLNSTEDLIQKLENDKEELRNAIRAYKEQSGATMTSRIAKKRIEETQKEIAKIESDIVDLTSSERPSQGAVKSRNDSLWVSAASWAKACPEVEQIKDHPKAKVVKKFFARMKETPVQGDNSNKTNSSNGNK